MAFQERKQRKGGKPAFEDVAADLNLWKQCDDIVFVTPVPKDKKRFSYRFILNFSLVHQVRQVLLREAILIMGRFVHGQTMFAGGVNEAMRQVKENYAGG